MTLAILPDPRGHLRLPFYNEEICDRALLVKQCAKPVLVATNDQGIMIDAHALGLD